MITPMVKVQIAVPLRDQERVMRWLQEEEILHVAPILKMEGKVADSQQDLKLAELQFVLEFISRIKKELNLPDKKAWQDLFAGKPAASLEALEKTLAKLNVAKMVREAHAFSDELMENASHRQELADEAGKISPWRVLEATGSDLSGSATSALMLIMVSLREELLVKKLLQTIPTAALREVARVVQKKNGHIFMELLVHRNEVDAAEKVITQTNAERVILNVATDETINGRWEKIQASIKKLEGRYQEILGSAKIFVKFEQEVRFAYDAVLHHKERLQIENRVVKFARTFIVGGWVPEKALAKTREKLAEEFPASAIEEAPAGKKEIPPVAFSNSRFIEPFEAVTNIFGKPRYHEVDPTAPLSLFFLLAFGLALTDGGYGLLMVVGMGMANKYFRLKKEMRKMVKLLMYAGASTFIFGALTGSWFGIALNELPPSAFRDFLLSVKLIDPIAEPMVLLGVAFALGITQLLFAWVVKGYDDWRKGDMTAVIFDDAAWVTMVIFLLLWAGSARGLFAAGSVNTWQWLMLLNAAVLILSQGRSYANPLLKLGAGIMSLYGLVGFVSDTLSYSRLLALGLATGIIALVVNLMGNMVYEGVPGVGWLLAIIVLLIGHTFNLGINALGAFIHSGRLQFVEFFPKFMEGGGEPYRPLGRVSKYVDNPKDFV